MEIEEEAKFEIPCSSVAFSTKTQKLMLHITGVSPGECTLATLAWLANQDPTCVLEVEIRIKPTIP